jgi:hypothetical protein
MAHIGEECRLGAVELGQRCRLFALFLIGARARKSGGDLTASRLTNPL